MPKVCNLWISLYWLCHHKIVMILQKQHIHQISILCTFLSQKWLTHFICREKRLAHFFCCENDLRTSFGKFLRVVFCHPESSYFLGLCFKDCPKVSKLLCNWQFQKVELWVKNFAQTGASVGFVQRVSQDLCTGHTVGRGGPVVPDPDRPCGSTWTDCQRPENQVGNANRKVFALLESFYWLPWNCTGKFLDYWGSLHMVWKILCCWESFWLIW